MNEKIQVTRQELIKLRRQLKTISSGQKLLEQKRDALIKELINLKNQYFKVGKEIENRLVEINLKLKKAFLLLKKNNRQIIEKKLKVSYEKNIDLRSIMGVKLTYLKVKDLKIENYPFKLTNIYFDMAFKEFVDIMPKFFELISLKDAIAKIATEIQKTRRRVNVLKDIIIPKIKFNIKTINLRLADFERESFVFNLKFKRKCESLINEQNSEV